MDVGGGVGRFEGMARVVLVRVVLGYGGGFWDVGFGSGFEGVGLDGGVRGWV